MQQTRIEIVLEAETGISHAEGTIGNVSVAMTRKARLPDGSFVRVPIVTADTMRHGLREAIVYATLDAAGLLTGDGPGLTEAAVRLLFSGGMLTGRGDSGAIKLDEWRKMLDSLPHLALFGGCCNNQMIPGQLVVSDALLICEETKHLVPAWQLDWCAAKGVTMASCRSHVEEEQRVRMDPMLQPEKRRLLESGAKDVVERRLVAREAAHDDDNAGAREATKSTMLPRTAEVIVPGSLFSWSVTATTYSDVEVDALHTALASFLANARVGGKRGTGHGKIRGLVANRIELARPSMASEAVDLNALAPKMGQLYRAHVGERAEAIKAVLGAVDA